MAVIKQVVGTRTALTITGFSTLAAATYVASAAYTANTNQPIDVVIEVSATTTNAAAVNKQVVVFAQASLDGTNYQTGPTSGTTITAETDLTFIGTVPVNDTNAHTKTFSIAQAFGYVPYGFKIILKNDLGVALTAGTVFTSEISQTVA